MKRKQERRPYVAPEIAARVVELEQGIASGSAAVNPGGSSSSSTPQTEDWLDNGSQNKDFDI